jgi:hypothetical protein
MTTYYIIEPGVPGELGEKTILDYSTEPPYKVVKLECLFYVLLNDDILEIHPCFIVTERLRKALEQFQGTGYQFDDVEITTDEQFAEFYPDLKLPNYYWMKIYGNPGIDDAGLTKRHDLVVSDRLLDILRRFNIQHCTIRRRPFRTT